MSNVSKNEMLVGVDIGTSKVVAIVAESRGSQIEITGLGTHTSKGLKNGVVVDIESTTTCLLYTSPSPRDLSTSRMPSSA